MKNVTIDSIKTKIEKLTCEFGGQGNVAITCAAYHACNPNRPNGWDATAVQLDGFILRIGTAKWDFDEFVAGCEADEIVIDDDGMYPWDNEFEFAVDDEFDLSDDDDMEIVLTLLK